MRVFVLNQQKEPLMPCHPARARKLLRLGKAALFRRFPFTIILKQETTPYTQPVALNIDPGSKVTGIALLTETQSTPRAVVGLHIEHRSHTIKASLDSRRGVRRGRRHRKTRYRAPRFLNRTRPKGWLAPSLQSRVLQTRTWAQRLLRLVPITHSNIETIRFDMQKMENPTIQGTEYQQGTLFGFECREYLLHRHKHTCAYCLNVSNDPILEVEHIVPRSLGGTDRIHNLVIACRTCNQDKSNLPPNLWQQQCSRSKSRLNQQRAVQMARILEGYRPTLKDAAAVNATRYAIGDAIQSLIPKTRFFSGGRTKKNRTAQNLPKDHWIDAACIGEVGSAITLEVNQLLIATAQGHGSRQFCRMDRYGFPRTSAKSQRSVHGFKTGDIVKATVTSGKKKGSYLGRVAVRSSGSFNITHQQDQQKQTTQGIHHRYCKKIFCCDGYGYRSTKIAQQKIVKGGSEIRAA